MFERAERSVEAAIFLDEKGPVNGRFARALLGASIQGLRASMIVLASDIATRREKSVSFEFARQMGQRGWEVSIVDMSRTDHPDREYLAIDGEPRYVSSFLISTPSLGLKHEARRYERLEQIAEPLEAYALYDAEQLLIPPEDAREVAFVSVQAWDRILAMLASNPGLLHDLDSRKFERLIAELLERQGLEVRITPRVRDGGRDILAFLKTPVGEHLYLVECKRYRADRPVGVALVRSLYGVVQAERATAGLLVTTSRFTSGALSYQRPLERQLALRDYNDLVAWLHMEVGVDRLS
jgi:HJR/Mrr/RecB family endonuclease